MEAVHNQQQLLEEGGGGVEMMVMESLDPALLQMKTEVNRSPVSVPSFSAQFQIPHSLLICTALWSTVVLKGYKNKLDSTSVLYLIWPIM